jgi:hypothetical protein
MVFVASPFPSNPEVLQYHLCMCTHTHMSTHTDAHVYICIYVCVFKFNSIPYIVTQGRGGDELSMELSVALQRCLLGGKSGAGMNLIRAREETINIFLYVCILSFWQFTPYNVRSSFT